MEASINNVVTMPFIDAIHEGDCVAMLNGWPGEWADLIFADPPFNIGYTYDVYHDKKPHEQYVEWTRSWLTACKRALKPTGSFYISIGDEYAADVRLIGRELGMDLRNWIVWSYTFGQNSRTAFCRSHVHIFYFVRDAKHFTFNDRAIRVPSARHTVYNDKRGDPLGRLPDDTWSEYPRVCGTFKERAGWHGCQMPEGLLARIIRASSNEGDIVLDPFLGSGTTAAVAVKLNRHYVGIDISPQYVEQAIKRVERAKQLRLEPANASGWTPLELEALEYLFRETKVPVATLASKPAALACFLKCLEARTGRLREGDDVLKQLKALTIPVATGCDLAGAAN